MYCFNEIYVFIQNDKETLRNLFHVPLMKRDGIQNFHKHTVFFTMEQVENIVGSIG